MTALEGIEPVRDLAKALGLLGANDQLDGTWFSDPGAHLAGMLRRDVQRDALVRALRALTASQDATPGDETWVPFVEEGPVALFVVLSVGPSGVVIGLGVRVHEDGGVAGSRVRARVPLLFVPRDDRPLETAFGTALGLVDVNADIDFRAAAPVPGRAALAGIGLGVTVATDGTLPTFRLALRGLQLPGQTAPHDVIVGAGASAPDQIGHEVLHLLSGLLRELAGSGTDPIARLLALVGLATRPAIPPLPLEDLADQGPAALGAWLTSLFGNEASLPAWLAELAGLTGGTVGRVGDVDRLAWTFGAANLAVRVAARRAPNGPLVLELGLDVAIDAAFGGLEATLSFVRITLGDAPSVIGLPYAELAARLGPRTGLLLDVSTPEIVRIGRLRTGVALSEDRSVRLLLAAEDVTLGHHHYATLDLTNTQTLADVGSNAVGDIAADLLERLAPVGTAIGVLLGIAPPTGVAWPDGLTVGLPALLADPIGAVLRYHRRVLVEHRVGYAAVLGSLAELLALVTHSAGVPGEGTEAEPYQITLVAAEPARDIPGLAIVVFTDAATTTWHLGLSLVQEVGSLPGPVSPRMSVLVELVRVALDGSGGRALPRVSLALGIAGHAGGPLRFGDRSLAVGMEHVGLALSLVDGRPSAALDAPGLALESEGVRAPITLPRLAPGGGVEGEIPWRAIELLGARLLVGLGLPWASTIADVLSWQRETGRLSLASLAAAPAPTLEAWLVDLAARSALDGLAAWLSMALAGPAAEGAAGGLTSGCGDPSAPLLVPLPADDPGDARASVAFFGAQLVPILKGDYLPPSLRTALHGYAEGREPDLDEVAALIGKVATTSATFSRLLAGRSDPGAMLLALATRLADTDGLAPAASAVLPGAASHEETLCLDELPSVDLEEIVGGPLGETIVVVGPDVAGTWPGVADDHVLDLTTPRVPPDGVSVGTIGATGGTWLVRLPSRVAACASPTDDGASLVAARLGRAVDAALARATSVTLVAHGAASHAALHVAASRPRVARVITLGACFTQPSLAILDVDPGASALTLFGSATPAAPSTDDPEEHVMVELGRALLAPLLRLYDGDLDASELGPAAGLAVPDPARVTCVFGRIPAAQAKIALVGLLARVLQSAHAEDTSLATARRTAATEASLCVGPWLSREPPCALGDVRVTTGVGLSLVRLGREQPPVLHARIAIERAGGFLAGGPDPARSRGQRRTPSVRRVEVELDLPLGVGASAAARIVLHEAEALGVRHTRWEIAPGDLAAGAPLLPEAAIVLGRAFDVLATEATTATPASLSRRALIDLLGALGLASTGATAHVVTDALRELLLDPAAFLRARRTAAAASVATALASWLGGASPRPGELRVERDGLVVEADLAAGTVRCATLGTGLALDAGFTLAGFAEIGAVPGVRAELALTFGAEVGPGGRPVLDVTTSPPRAVLRVEHPDAAVASSVALYPVADTRGLEALAVSWLPAQLLWGGLTALRGLVGPRTHALDSLLTAVGLLVTRDSLTRVVVPAGLLSAPGTWLEQVFVDGDRVRPLAVQGLFSALGDLLGIPARSGLGSWRLPYGLGLAVEDVSGNTRLAFTVDEAVPGVGLRLGGGASLELGAIGTAPTPHVELLLGLPGAPTMEASARLSIGFGATGVEGRLILPATGADIPLFPQTDGLAALGNVANAAVTYALPYALDALVASTTEPAATIGRALGSLGDGLGLRESGRFSGARFQELARNPGPYFAERLFGTTRPGAWEGFAELVRPALPTGFTLAAVDMTDGSIQVRGVELVKAGPLSARVRVAVPITGALPTGVRIAVSVDGVPVFDVGTLGAALRIDERGLSLASASFAVAEARPLRLGPASLAPVASIEVGADAQKRATFGLALAGGAELRAVVGFEPVSFALEPTGAQLAEAIVRAVVPLAADLALSIGAVQELLARTVLSRSTIRSLVSGVLLVDAAAATPPRFDPDVLLLDQLWRRLLRLAQNIAALTPSLPIAPLRVGIVGRTEAGGAQVFGLSVTMPSQERFTLVSGETKVDLEVDDTWITPAPGETDGTRPPSGITVELLRVSGAPGAESASATFGFALRGVGVRVSRAAGPLLDSAITIDSLAVHGYFAADLTGVLGGGGQLELGRLRVPLGSARGNSNAIASGIMRDSAAGPERPEPAFSPALALLKHRDAPFELGLRAGPGDGPWWMTIQRGFGPVYIEQVGFGVMRSGHDVVGARILVDGRVSMFGLNLAVDDLALAATWAGPYPLYDPRSWEVGLAGLALSSDLGGVKLTGGFRKSTSGPPEYLGLVSIRWSSYSLSAFGGYAVTPQPDGSEFVSLFLYGALSAPFGGPPPFFLTGIAAGFAINRRLVLPDDFSQLASYPMLRALDPHAPTLSDPMAALDELRAYFPPASGSFWIAAGISWTTYTVVECVAVLAVAIGDGVEINLLGLARASLPNPAAPLVVIELALLVRFSSREGVLWIQGQLTDNSWLLTRDCRLTGGFAFVTWWKGPNQGQFVLTLGGYHPSFHHDGYPVVPRVGLVWSIGDYLVIKGETYFALTSEAIMAGVRVEATLTLGPLWAYVRFGADGIVWFDPFKYEVTAFAEIGAGITIDIDFGFLGHLRVELSFHLHADVLVAGPEFHGRATIDLGVASATVAFGDEADHGTHVLEWPAFFDKYLAPGGASVLTFAAGDGLVPASPGDTKKPATGAEGDPFLFLPEMSAALTSSGAIDELDVATPVAIPDTDPLAIGPMQLGSVTSTLRVRVRDAHGVDWTSSLRFAEELGEFPKGVWAPQLPEKPVPKGETIHAATGVRFTAVARIAPGLPEVRADRIDTGPRLPLPFLSESQLRPVVSEEAARAAELITTLPQDRRLETARAWMTDGAMGLAPSALLRATFARRRSAPPQLVPLAVGLAAPPLATVHVLPRVAVTPPKVTPVLSPRVVALLRVPLAPAAVRLTVGERGQGVRRLAAPTIRSVHAALGQRTLARLVPIAPDARLRGRTLAPRVVPHTGRAASVLETHRGPLLRAVESRLAHGAVLRAGEILVVRFEGADRVRGGASPVLVATPAKPEVVTTHVPVAAALSLRAVALDAAGCVLADLVVTGGTTLLPSGTERVVAIGAPMLGVPGFTPTSLVARVGTYTFVASGCVVVASRGKASLRAGRAAHAGLEMARTALASADALTIRFARRVASVAVTLHRDTLSDTPPLLVCGGTPLPASAAARDGDLITFRYALPLAKDPWSEVQLRIDDGDRIAGVVGTGAHDAKRGAPSALATTSGVAAHVSLLHAGARETTTSLDETRDA